jgi:hypothetical protein
LSTNMLQIPAWPQKFSLYHLGESLQELVSVSSLMLHPQPIVPSLQNGYWCTILFPNNRRYLWHCRRNNRKLSHHPTVPMLCRTRRKSTTRSEGAPKA